MSHCKSCDDTAWTRNCGRTVVDAGKACDGHGGWCVRHVPAPAVGKLYFVCRDCGSAGDPRDDME